MCTYLICLYVFSACAVLIIKSVLVLQHGGSCVEMANICFEPPPVFDFKNPDEWPHWKRRFEQFCLASGLAKEEESRQVSSLLYCLGEEGEDVLLAF